MTNYLCETNFWTTDDDISIKHTDLGAFKYESKKRSGCGKSVYVEGKRAWVEGRGGRWRGGGGRVREGLRQLLGGTGGRMVHCQWLPPTPLPTLRLLLTSGALLYVGVHPATSQPVSLHMDKYLMGKLPNNNIHQALFLSKHVLVVYSDSQALLVSLNKPASVKSVSSIPDKLSSRDPKIQMVDLCGGGSLRGRGIGGVSCNVQEDLVLLWRRASPSDLFPWTPHNDQDNVHIYSLNSNQMSVVCNHRVEFDPVWVAFSKLQSDLFFSVEQKTSKKGGVIIEWLHLRVSGGSIVREEGEARVGAPAPATCATLSPCEKRLLVTCSDRSILIHHSTKNLTTTVQAAFIGRRCLWWSEGILVCGGAVQLQGWDHSLAPLYLTPPTHQPSPTPHLDLSSYFKKEPVLEDMVWREGHVTQTGFLHTDGLLLLMLQGGLLISLRLYIPHSLQEVAPVVHRGQERGALAKLRALDWSTQGSQCLLLLHQLVTALFALPLNSEREQLLEAALATFLAPATPLPPATRQAHLPHLHDLCRKFFHLLIRYRRLEKALCLAIDVGHQDLFMDVHYAARNCGNQSLAQEALQHAQNVDSACDSCCSDPSCSGCSDDGSGSDSRSESDVGGSMEGHMEGGKVSGPPLDIYGPPLSSRPAPPPPPLPDVTQSHLLHTERQLSVEWPPLYRPVYPPPPRLHALYRSPPCPPTRSHPPEKNKVKFSDTVTVAVVPQETPRKDRRPVRTGPPDWRKELADSLPLCDPNNDYLKDFTPNPVMETQEAKQEKTAKIKVVHFGVV